MARCRLTTVLFTLLFAATLPPAAGADERKELKEAAKLVEQGDKALRSGKLDQAEQKYLEAAALGPDLPAPHRGLGQVYMTQKRYAEALAALERCKERLLVHQGQSAKDRLKQDAAIEEKIIALQDQLRSMDSGGKEASFANAGAMRTELEEQIRRLDQMRQRDRAPGALPADLHLLLGSAHFRLDHKAEAEAEFRAAIAADPKLGEAHNNLAVLLFLGGRNQEAKSEVEAAEKAGFPVVPAFKQKLDEALAAATP
jgi:tetratricopeptide (TPR) repeat protein